MEAIEMLLVWKCLPSKDFKFVFTNMRTGHKRDERLGIFLCNITRIEITRENRGER